MRGLHRFSERRWRRAYHRLTRDTFQTVPFYREQWALVGTDPVPAGRLAERRRDLVPLGGGELAGDAWRGFASVASAIGRRANGVFPAGRAPVLAVVTDLPPPRPAARALPARPRVCCLPPPGRAPNPFDTRFGTPGELARLASAGVPVAVLGTEAELAGLAGLAELAELAGLGHLDGVLRLPVYPACRPVPAPPTPGAVIRDGLLGYLAVSGRCGQWHLDWRHVYARDSAHGVAVSLLRQRSPRLVDVAPGLALRVARCPAHRTPTLAPDLSTDLSPDGPR